MKYPITLTSEIKVEPIQSMGGDHMVVAAARVSTNGESARQYAEPDRAEGNAGLINYLMAHRHGTPFEHAAMTFFVHAPIFVWREWHRHRIAFSYNEESGRYKQLDPVFWVPRRDRAMIPVVGWKPGKPRFDTLDDWAGRYFENEPHPSRGYRFHADEKYDREVGRDIEVYEIAYRNYRESIDDDFAMEVARCKLPVAIYSACWVTCNPRSLMAFLSLRVHDENSKFVSYPQAEIQEAAEMCERFLELGWPLTHQAFVSNGRVAP